VRIVFLVVKKIPTGMILLPQQNPTEQKEPPPRQKTNSSPKLLLLLLRARACACVRVRARRSCLLPYAKFSCATNKIKDIFHAEFSLLVLFRLFSVYEMFLMRIFFFLLENDEIAAHEKFDALLCFVVLSFAL